MNGEFQRPPQNLMKLVLKMGLLAQFRLNIEVFKSVLQRKVKVTVGPICARIENWLDILSILFNQPEWSLTTNIRLAASNIFLGNFLKKNQQTVFMNTLLLFQRTTDNTGLIIITIFDFNFINNNRKLYISDGNGIG